MISRRQFFQWGGLAIGAIAGVTALTPLRRVVARNAGQLLDPRKQPKFVNALPIPKVIEAQAGDQLLIAMKESQHWFGLYELRATAPRCMRSINVRKDSPPTEYLVVGNREVVA